MLWKLSASPERPYVLMLELFISRRIGPDELEALFFPFFKDDRSPRSKESIQIVERFFYDLDDYAPDSSPADESPSIDEEALRRRAQATLARLDSLRA
jgi:hypothetical protein